MAAATVPLKDRIQQQYAQLLDNFANLLRSARLPDEAGDAGGRSQVRWPAGAARAATPRSPPLAAVHESASRAAGTGRGCSCAARGCMHRTLPPTPAGPCCKLWIAAPVQVRVPGELLDVFAEKMLQARSLLPLPLLTLLPVPLLRLLPVLAPPRPVPPLRRLGSHGLTPRPATPAALRPAMPCWQWWPN